jgi:hypothetical protein
MCYGHWMWVLWSLNWVLWIPNVSSGHRAWALWSLNVSVVVTERGCCGHWMCVVVTECECCGHRAWPLWSLNVCCGHWMWVLWSLSVSVVVTECKCCGWTAQCGQCVPNLPQLNTLTQSRSAFYMMRAISEQTGLHLGNMNCNTHKE